MQRQAILRFFRLVCLASTLAVGLAVAQTATQPTANSGDANAEAVPVSTDKALAAARKQLDALRQRMGTATTLQALSDLRSEASGLQSSNADLAASLAPQVANLEAGLAELGPAPTGKNVEAPDLTARRVAATQQRAQLDAQMRLARLLSIESAQLGRQLDELRRSRFEAQIGERTPSLLVRPFWTDLRTTWIKDTPAVVDLRDDVWTAVRAVPVWIWAVALIGVAGLFALLPLVRRLLVRFATARMPHGRIRRSFVAVGIVARDTGAILLATYVVYGILQLGPDLSPSVESLVLGLGKSISFATFVAALGRALLSPSRPSWRLLPISDETAERLKKDSLWLGIVIAVGWSLERLATLVDAGLPITVATTTLFSLALNLTVLRTMRRVEKARRSAATEPGDTEAPPRPVWQLAIVVLISGALLVSIGSLLSGYVAFGSMLVKQLVWAIVVIATAYLVTVFADDVCSAWLRVTTDDDAPSPAQPGLRNQVAVLLSGLLRVAVVLVAFVLVLGPLGQAPLELMQRTDQLRDGVAIGEIRILPSAVFQCVFVLAVGIALVRACKSWLLNRYLPTTTMDAGMRVSTATLLGYVGMVFAIALALSALGIGLERVAWVASALSVGIGFGLQAVVQNFVSGLILLTERPVKVGDWVSLGGVEGDIRRINVRATEIQMGDRSTVIVPNSEFITKVVRNVTHANPLGLVQLKLPMPLDSDPERVRSLVLDVFADHEDVVADPAPNVQLDGIEGGSLIFVATGSVSSPREAGGVRSALLFEILARFRKAGLALGKPQTMVLREPPAPPATAVVPGAPS